MTAFLVAAAVVLLPVGCGPGGDVGSGDGTGGDEGLDGGTGCLESDDMPWILHCPTWGSLAPLAVIDLRVDGIAAGTTEIVLWMGEGDDVYSPVSVVPDPGGVEGRYIVTAVLPALNPGIYRVALGSTTERTSNTIELPVEVPTPRLSQTEAADLLGRGLSLLVSDTRALFLENESPEWQSLLAETYSPEKLAELAAFLSDLERAAALAREDYLALSPGDEAVVQAALESAGLLEAFVGMQRTAPGWPTRSLDIIPSPLQLALIGLDVESFFIDLAGTTLDLATVIAAVVPGGQPAAAVGVCSKVVVAGVKFVIDTFVPTDLMGIQVHNQPLMFDGEVTTWTFWGDFQPQNTAGGALRSLDDFVVEAVSEVYPVPLRVGRIGALRTYLLDLVRSLSIRLGFSTTRYLPGADVVITGLFTPITLDVYGTPLLELARWIPGMDSLTGFVKIANLFDALRPLSVDFATPAWSDPSLHLLGRRVSLSGVAWPTPSPLEMSFVNLIAQGFRLSDEDLWIFEVPTWNVVNELTDTTLRQAPDPANPNELPSDERYVYARLWPYESSSQWTVITESVAGDRTVPINVGHMGGFRGGALINVYVNDVLQVGAAAPPFITMAGLGETYLLTLRPGLNRVRVQNLNTDLLDCSTGAVSGQGCLVVEFRGADNADISKAIVFGSTPDNTFTFEVWTPPAYRSP
ncbi:MAG: hypothetical protein HY907_15875 [Deltaproteobacteria bacterium]|nr:hypothetical protein [Deltaproteobacteria bacterium]